MYKKYPIFLALLLNGAGLLQAAMLEPEQLQNALTGNTNACQPDITGLSDEAKQRLIGLYERVEFRSIWDDTSRQAALKTALGELENDGLTPADYLPSATNQAPICQELALSHAYLSALKDLSFGKVGRGTLAPLWRAESDPAPSPTPTVVQYAVTGINESLANAFTSARPSSIHYQALRQEYQRLKKTPGQSLPKVPNGPTLKPGMQDARIPALAKHLSARGYLPADRSFSYYDAELVQAVKAFQRDAQLQADGVLGPQSLKALNMDNAQRLKILKVNLERWRWLEHEMSDEQVLVDIAGGVLSYEKAGQVLWQGRTQVGRLKRRTPEIKSNLNRVTLNPTWTIPPTILREDKLPRIRRDPSFLARNGLKVIDRNGNVVSPSSVNWSNPGAYSLRQPAGPSNPLGKMVLRFDNPHSIYLHDTPSQHLFNRSSRDVSSGCVRVEGIASLLAALVDEAELAQANRYLKTRQTHNQRLSRHIPILLGYWTAQADANGRVQLHSDIYNLDQALAQALDRPKK